MTAITAVNYKELYLENPELSCPLKLLTLLLCKARENVDAQG